ncbi:MAG: ABC transporter substrate-binding protein [Deltaproteobacteria bacterium]|nr:ABC transporter substrate-binding protein [Deltaproteobacteria bacterium]MBI3076297.1 ABC transporter substrate-binding protein [Deltaproteobacteria bacterium]
MGRQTPLTLAIALTILGLLLTPGAAPLAAPLDKMVYATAAGGAAGIQTAVIKARRLDERHGILLDLRPFNPAEAEFALLYKKVDTGFFAPTSGVRANLKGSRLRFIGPSLYSHYSLTAHKNVQARRLEDLKGKRIGTLDRVSGGYNALAVLCRMLGLDLEKDFRLTIGTPPGLMTFLQRGDVDAANLFDPLTTKLILDGHREVVRLSDLWMQLTGKPMVLTYLAAHQEWLDANRDVARRFVKTMLDATAVMRSDPNVFEEKLVRDQIKPRTAQELDMVKERMPKIYPTTWDQSLVDNGKLLLQKTVEVGLLERLPEEEMFVILR